MESMSAIKSKKRLCWNVSLIIIVITLSTYLAILIWKALRTSISYLFLTEHQQGKQLFHLPVGGCIVGWQMIVH